MAVPVQVLVMPWGSHVMVCLNLWITRYALYSRSFSKSLGFGPYDDGGVGDGEYPPPPPPPIPIPMPIPPPPPLPMLMPSCRRLASEVRAVSAMHDARRQKRARRRGSERPAIF
uniref:Uncharacterized protein n=1 Tax=Triticum urartu TaxID=4572 RepID=A0A8R7PHR1_TRIUA